MYKIKLDKFEGPLDLLLFFVRKDELNIYDIPIAHITKSYLDYLKLMQDLNLDIASEFILMAATLMRIKVRCMLPPEPGEEQEEEPLDPREELTRRLIEYRQFKDASRNLSDLDDQWRMVYRRNYFDTDRLPPPEEAMGLKNISFFDLLAAYKKAISKTTEVVYHNVERLNVTVEEQIEYITNFFTQRNGALFSELCEGMCKIEIVVTFLALLDMIRREAVFVRQSSVFDDIWIQKEKPEDDEALMPERVTENVQDNGPGITEDQQVSDHTPDAIETVEFEISRTEINEPEPIEVSEVELTPDEALADNESTGFEDISGNLVDISVLTDQLKSPETEILPVVDEVAETTIDVSESSKIVPSKDNTDNWIDDIQDSLETANTNLSFGETQEPVIQSSSDLQETEPEQISSQPILDIASMNSPDLSQNSFENNTYDTSFDQSQAHIRDDIHETDKNDFPSAEITENSSDENDESKTLGLTPVRVIESEEESGQDNDYDTVQENELSDELRNITETEPVSTIENQHYKEIEISDETDINEGDERNEIEPSSADVSANDSHAEETSSLQYEMNQTAEANSIPVSINPPVAHPETELTKSTGSVENSPDDINSEKLADKNVTEDSSAEKHTSQDSGQEQKPSVLRVIFTRVILFVKKFFKR